ncbi:MAG TPA: hypothetical protein VIG06_16790 [Kofleriaceae bacterium]|jgi:hypothetical protein
MRAPALIACLAAAASGCIDTFEGVDIQMTFDEGVFGASAEGGSTQPGQPPPGTYFTLYAIELVDDGAGEVARSFSYEISRFEIVPLIDPGSPCFIEVENLEQRIYPGLHVTQLAERIKADSGIDDPLNPPDGASEGDVIDILTAERRVSYLPQLSASLRAVVSPSVSRVPEVDTGCVGDGTDTSPDLIPPPECIDDESNARRLALCEDLWSRRPDQYEGSDRSFTDPLNGTFYGLVDGMNPKNGAPLGGVELVVDVDWRGFQEVAINWQYEDRDENGEPDWPEDLPDSERSIVGFHYLEGEALEIKRGVITYPLRNRSFTQIAGEATVLHDLGEDHVNF